MKHGDRRMHLSNKIQIIISFILLFCIVFQIYGISFYNTQNNKYSTIYYPNQNTEHLVSTGEADEWPMFGHDAGHSGVSSSTGPRQSLIWSKTYGAGSIASPVVANNKVYFQSMDFTLHALDASNGAELWNYSNGGTPVIIDDLIYFNSGSTIYCLYTSNGSLKTTSVNLGAITRTPIVYENGLLFVSLGNKKIDCLFAENLSVKWSSSTGSGSPGSPTIANNDVFVSTTEPRVYCLYIENGAERWNKSVGSSLLGTSGFTSTVVGDLLFIGGMTTVYRMYCLDADNGSQKWVTTVDGGFYRTPPAVSAGKVIFGYQANSDRINRFLCLNTTNGQKEWEYLGTSGYTVQSSAVIAGNLVYICSETTLYCLDIIGNGNGTTNLIWSQNVQTLISSSPAIVNGFLYLTVQNMTGGPDIFCFGGNNSPPAQPVAPSGPSDGFAGELYSFTEITTDPENDAITYLFDWGDETTDTWTSFVASGEQTSSSHVWTSAGTFLVKVKAKDTYGLQAVWSPPKTFLVNSMPLQLQITAPLTCMESQTFDIVVTVDENPIANATVEFNTELFSTDITGKVTVTAPQVEQNTQYSIQVSCLGYLPATSTITILHQREKQGWIYGVVSDTNGTLLTDALVCIFTDIETLDTSKQCTYTDTQGQYVKSFPIGTYVVEASKQGYQSETRTNITIEEKKAIAVNFNLRKITNNTTPVDTQQKLINEAILEGSILGTMTFASEQQEIHYTTVVYLSDSTLTITQIQKNSISLVVSSENEGGSTIVFNIEEGVFSTDNLGLLLNGRQIKKAGSFEEVLHPTNANEPEWFIQEKPSHQGSWLLLYIPHFSQYQITIYQIVEAISKIILGSIYGVIFVIGAIIAVYIVMFSGTIRFQRKKIK
jgi:outer membrane protein assembly factor BamB